MPTKEDKESDSPQRGQVHSVASSQGRISTSSCFDTVSLQDGPQMFRRRWHVTEKEARRHPAIHANANYGQIPCRLVYGCFVVAAPWGLFRMGLTADR